MPTSDSLNAGILEILWTAGPVAKVVLGILLLLGVGYLWLAQDGTGIGRSLDWPSRLRGGRASTP